MKGTLNVTVILVTALALGPNGAHAQTGVIYKDGNELHELCTEYKDFAFFYALGVVDGLGGANALVDVDLKYCMPAETITARQVEDILCHYVEANPEQRHHPAPILALNSLVGAFPCSN